MSIDFDLDRDPVEQIAEVFLDEIRRGSKVTVESYANEYPNHANAIHALFPTLVAMEDAKGQVKQATGIEDTDPLLTRHLNRLGDFRIIRRIGHGGMGVVYEAEQESLERRVAVKVLSPSLVTTPKQIARFRRESHAAASLHHGNIVPVFGVGEQLGVHYYIMQRIHGCGLDELLRPPAESERESPTSRSKLQRDDFDQIAKIGTKVADALSYAHSQGILHRDIKPANIMLDDDGVPWVMDFGLAKSLEGSSDFTQTGQAVGTLRYMPPEQFRRNADERSDVYSLGITLYELLTWQPAFGGSNRSRLIESISAGRLTRPSLINDRVPRDLETIVLKAVAPDPRHRYQTARALGDDLQRFVEDLPIRARRASVLHLGWRWSRKNPALAAACASVVLLLFTLTARSHLAYLRIQDALTKEKVEKQKADVAFRTATSAIDSMFDRFVPDHDSVNESGAAISPEVAELMESMLGYYEDIATRQGGSPQLRLKAAQAQSKIARIHHRLGQHQAAIEDYENAIMRLQDVGSEARHSALDEARLRNELGRVYEVINRKEKSDQQHKLAIELLGTTDLNLEETIELARAHYLLARLVSPSESVDNIAPFRFPERRDEVLLENRELLTKAATLLDSVRENYPDSPAARHLLGLCLVELPNHNQRGQVGEQFDRGIQLLRSLVEEEPNSVDYRFDLLQSLSFGLPPHHSMKESELQRTGRRLKEAIELGESLVREQPGVPIYNLSLAHCYFKLHKVMDLSVVPRGRRMKNRDESRRLNTRAIQLQSLVVHSHPEAIGYRVWLADYILAKFDGYLRDRRPEKAQPFLNRAIRVLEVIPTDQRQHPRIKERLDYAYRRLDEFYIPALLSGTSRNDGRPVTNRE